MSFLKIGDRAAGAIKSGGTTRRAAKMVTVDLDHPDIEDYIDWKVIEEQKVAALVAGSQACNVHLNRGHARPPTPAKAKASFDPHEEPGAEGRDPRGPQGQDLRRTTSSASSISRSRATSRSTSAPTTPTGTSEAYLTVSGQNSNNSVRISNDFIQKVIEDGDWNLIRRTDGKVHKTVKARDLWEKIGDAAWAFGRSGRAVRHHHQRVAHLPGIGPHQRLQSVLGIHVPGRHGLQSGLAQPDDLPEGGRPRSTSRPTSTPCRLWTVVLEISVLMAQFPSKEIAQLSYDFRTLGLGYANVGGLLMAMGLSYDSDEGRALTAALTAIMTGVSYATSAEMAGELGAFPSFDKNRDAMLRVIRNHRRAAYGETVGYEGLSVLPVPLDARQLPRRRPARRRAPGLGPGPDAGRAARLSQRAGHGDRADRHDRPGDGLRHHRHRARLRAGEVQEAGRRRLLQDHQPHGAGRAAQARLCARTRSRRSSATPSATAR